MAESRCTDRTEFPVGPAEADGIARRSGRAVPACPECGHKPVFWTTLLPFSWQPAVDPPAQPTVPIPDREAVTRQRMVPWRPDNIPPFGAAYA